MDSLPHSTKRIPRFVLHRLNRASQSRLYTLETIQRRLRRKVQPQREEPRPGSEPESSIWPRVEAFGKLRTPHSNAAKVERFRESRKIEKALKHEHHGENVYAYVHIGTGQVVYSLTRVMDNHNILSQLVFHGKKTVPASLRRDLWTPYFSMHLPSSYTGLLAYHQLRELSLQRQLSPPDSLVMTTIATASKAMRAKMSKEQEETWDEEREGQPYRDGLPRLKFRRERAKALMQQKATSVADVAFVIELLQREGHVLSASAAEERVEARRARRLQWAGKSRRTKLRKLWTGLERRKKRYEEKRMQVQEGTKWGLEKYAAKRIAMEHGGVVVDPYLGRTKVILPRKADKEEEPEVLRIEVDEAAGEEVELTDKSSDTTTNVSEKAAQSDSAADTSTVISKKEEQPTSEPPETTATTPKTPAFPVRIFWSDLRDATYAAKWPQIVLHGELERMAVSRLASRDREGNMGVPQFRDRSVHVIGVGRVAGDDERGDTLMRGVYERRGAFAKEDEGDKGSEPAVGSDPDPDASKSREEQTEQLEKEGVVVEPRTGLWGWAKRRLGLAS